MRSLSRIFGPILLVTSMSSANASGFLTGPIKELYVNHGSHANVVYISVGVSFSTPCGATSQYLIMDLSEPSMKEAYAMALGASLAGRQVTLAGSGACIGVTEKLKFIFMVQ